MLAVLIDVVPPQPELAIFVPLLPMLISISWPIDVLPPLSPDPPQFSHFLTAKLSKPPQLTSAILAVTVVSSILHCTHPRSGTTHRSKPDWCHTWWCRRSTRATTHRILGSTYRSHWALCPNSSSVRRRNRTGCCTIRPIGPRIDVREWIIQI